MAALAIVIRTVVDNGADPLGINFTFRATAAAVMLCVAVLSTDWSRFPALWDIAGVHGLLASAFFAASGLASIKAVQSGRLGISWTVLRCSMVVPTLASLIYWKEVALSPENPLLVTRLAGICVAILAIALLTMDHNTQKTVQSARGRFSVWITWLAVAFIAQGLWEVALNATRAFPDDATRSFFVTVVFVSGCFLTAPVAGLARARIGRTELMYGMAAGACSLLASGVRVWALRDLDGVLLFPITTISVILLVQVAGRLIWNERTGSRGITGVALAILAVLLLNMRL